MTQIDFYTRVDDKLATACKLTAKAFQQGLRVLVLTPDGETTEKVDRLLWTLPATGFIPHCRNASPLAAVTPVIVDHAPEPLPHDEVLINLCPARPAFFSRFQRLVEIVSIDEADSQAARERYRFYQQRGYAIQHHDLSALRGRG